MKKRRLVAMMVPVIAVAGMMTFGGSTAAQAYCPTDPSGMDYGTNDPAADNYSGDEVDCTGNGTGPGTGSIPGSTGDGSPALGADGTATDSYGDTETQWNPDTDPIPDAAWNIDWSSAPATGPIDWSKLDFSDAPVVPSVADASVGSSAKRTIYETSGDDGGAYLPFPYPGRTDDEAKRTDKGGDSSLGAEKIDAGGIRTYKNPDAGKRAKKGAVLSATITDITGSGVPDKTLTGVQDLYKVAKVRLVPGENSAGDVYIVGMLVEFNDSSVPWNVAGRINSIFVLTNGDISQCSGKGALFYCTLTTPRSVSLSGLDTTPLVGDVPESTRGVALCSGGIVDAGYGKTTSFSLTQAGCDAAPDIQPTRMSFDRVDADSTNVGSPMLSSDGTAISFTPTEAAAGQYVAVRAWAYSDDGASSFPFEVIFRVRNAPTAKDVAAVNAIRSVESVTPASSLFADADIDQHEAESHDQLTVRIDSAPKFGVAYVDGSNNLHYVPNPLARGGFDDSITVSAYDSFGLPSPEVTIPIHVGDVVPGCATTGTTTDARTPVRVELKCWLTAPTGWFQLPGESISYAIASGPQFGSVSGFDPNSGTAFYTPDASHPGPQTVHFTASYNGQTRDAQYTINVVPAP